MSILAHVVQHEESITDKLFHPFTGLDHLLSMAFVAASIALVCLALRGQRAATTTGSITRVRSRFFVGASAVLLGASLLTLVLL